MSKEFVILYAGEVIARCMDFTFRVGAREIPLTTLDSADWAEIMKDEKEWEINFNALIARTGSTNYEAMLDDLVENQDPVTVSVGARRSGASIRTGEAFIMSVEFRAQVGDRAMYSGRIKGTGELLKTTMPSFAADFLTFTVPSQVGESTINSTTKTVAINMPFGSNVTALVATFTTSPNVSAVKIGTKLQVSGTTPNNFTAPVVYRIIGGDLEVEDWTVTLTVAAEE